MGSVNAERPESADATWEIPTRALLGLSNARAAVSALQFSAMSTSMSKAAQRTAVCHGLAGMMAIHALLGALSPLILMGWALALGFMVHANWRIERLLADTPLTGNKRHWALSAAPAVTWGALLLCVTITGTANQLLETWAIAAMAMAGLAFVSPALPLGTVAFCAVTGAVASGGFVWMGLFDSALAVLLLSLALGLGAIENARNLLTARIAQSAVHEKSEVVSLLLREFEEGEADWLWQTDTARRVRAASPRFAFALGLDPDQIEGQPLIQLIAGEAWQSGQFPPSLHELAERLKRREHFSNQLVRVTIKGQARWWELSGTPKLDEQGEFDGYRGVGSDVTAQRESADQIANLARYDTLTGLPNRLMLTETMADAMRQAERWRSKCAFLMIDLDRFKAVNDTLGHVVGDQLLARVSARLREMMTDNEICGRLGGDEFAVVIRDASDLGRVDRVAQSVIERLSQPYEVDHHTLYVGASVGSAIGPRDGSTVETLMRNADLALYRAKDAGRGAHCSYEPILHADAEERRKLEFSLRRALERGELLLHFQPVVDAQTELVVSFEALLRWDSAEHGMVSPAKFIPLAEDTRLIIPIGEWVLKQACRQAMEWPGHIKVAVNVSGEQLLDPHFAGTVVSALASSGLPAHRLEIEVTESIFLRDATTARATLEQCMALGCEVALDDFGTGYSSLGYLRKLRFSTIKVDRSFVQGAATGNAESLAIIRAVVAMAQSLDMSTTAEGVETEAELEVVRKLGATRIQGYYFGRPMIASFAP